MKNIIILFTFLMCVFSNAHAFKIVAISDLNGSYGSTKYSSTVTRAVEKIKEINPDMILITGDMVAGMKSGLDYNAMWRSFFSNVITPLKASKLLIAPTPGNHDGSAYSAYKTERAIYKSFWPQGESSLEFVDSEHYPFYYSFKKSDVLFISLDVTTVGALASKQKTWLLKQLKDRSIYKHIVVFSHVPLYPFANNREEDAMFDKELEDILNENNVEFYISGHHHAYFPGKRNNLKLISNSCLGSGARSLIGSSERSAKSFTVIDLSDDDFSIKALKSPSFTQSIDHEELPGIVNPGKYQIHKID